FSVACHVFSVACHVFSVGLKLPTSHLRLQTTLFLNLLTTSVLQNLVFELAIKGSNLFLGRRAAAAYSLPTSDFGLPPPLLAAQAVS
ncbi:MAG: hypothetical protein DA408_18390, partial [Bacteroidetes bacterium]